MARSLILLAGLVLATCLLSGCVVEEPGYWHPGWGWHHGWYHDRD